MKKVEFTGEEIEILKSVLLRPTDAATAKTILSIIRLQKPLKLDEDLAESQMQDLFEVELEDQDLAFLKQEWQSVNVDGGGIFRRGTFSEKGIDAKATFERFNRIVALDKKIKSTD